jgi:hypothetical protein
VAALTGWWSATTEQMSVAFAALVAAAALRKRSGRRAAAAAAAGDASAGASALEVPGSAGRRRWANSGAQAAAGMATSVAGSAVGVGGGPGGRRSEWAAGDCQHGQLAQWQRHNSGAQRLRLAAVAQWALTAILVALAAANWAAAYFALLVVVPWFAACWRMSVHGSDDRRRRWARLPWVANVALSPLTAAAAALVRWRGPWEAAALSGMAFVLAAQARAASATTLVMVFGVYLPCWWTCTTLTLGQD